MNCPRFTIAAWRNFKSGDFAKAASDLESLTLKAEATPQLEPIFYTLGSAWFSTGDHKKAIAAFQNYQKKFPNGAHLPEAMFAIAQCNLSLKSYNDAANGFALLEKTPRLREQPQAALHHADFHTKGSRGTRAWRIWPRGPGATENVDRPLQGHSDSARERHVSFCGSG
jgi:tetratricopeptide (TPR) repeat protein